MRLIVRGRKIMTTASVLTLGFALESDFGRYEPLYMVLLAFLVLSGIVIGIRDRLRGAAKQKEEVSRGYTCDARVARRQPELYALNYRTLDVVARPYER
jgi:hypothetical protein